VRFAGLENMTMSLSHRLGLLGRKVGMMRIFTDDGDAVPVTVLDVSNNRVTQVKTEQHRRLQRPAGGVRHAQGISRVNKPEPATWPRPG
jgi:large subunit ribosomal protein L3